MTNPPIQAQAVLDAFNNTGCNSRQWCDGKAPQIKLAAALEAVADQVVPEEPGFDLLEALSPDYWNQMNAKKYQREESRRQLFAIAAELRRIND